MDASTLIIAYAKPKTAEAVFFFQTPPLPAEKDSKTTMKKQWEGATMITFKPNANPTLEQEAKLKLINHLTELLLLGQLDDDGCEALFALELELEDLIDNEPTIDNDDDLFPDDELI